MRCTKISPEFECQGQKSKVMVTGDKKRRFCLEAVLYTGGKISACCLVFLEQSLKLNFYCIFLLCHILVSFFSFICVVYISLFNDL